MRCEMRIDGCVKVEYCFVNDCLFVDGVGDSLMYLDIVHRIFAVVYGKDCLVFG